MNSDRRLTVICGQVDCGTALRHISEQTAGIAVAFERSVLYPYLWFTAQCSVPTIGGRKAISVDCLVDGVNGHGATTDAFLTDTVRLSDETQLPRGITRDASRRTAQRTVTHRLGKKLKMIAPFDVRLEERGTVYKRFWIVRVGDGRVMIDSVTGSMHPLSARAA